MSMIYCHTQPYLYTLLLALCWAWAARFRVVSHPPFFHRPTFRRPPSLPNTKLSRRYDS